MARFEDVVHRTDTLSTSLKWRLFRGNIDRNQVIEMMSVDDEESGGATAADPEIELEVPGEADAETAVSEEEADQPGRLKEVGYRYGINLRSRGTVQHDATQWYTHKPEYSSNHYTLAIAARENWGGVTTPLPLSVVVRIEDTSRTAHVYTEVRDILATIEVEAQSRA